VGLPEMSSPMLGETDLKPSGAGRCGDADPVAGDTGPDRREGVGRRTTSLVRRCRRPLEEEECYVTADLGEEKRAREKQLAQRRGRWESSRERRKSDGLFASVRLWADPRG
jgi:hypothetical protein